jgi:hypothetical protein
VAAGEAGLKRDVAGLGAVDEDMLRLGVEGGEGFLARRGEEFEAGGCGRLNIDLGFEGVACEIVFGELGGGLFERGVADGDGAAAEAREFADWGLGEAQAVRNGAVGSLPAYCQLLSQPMAMRRPSDLGISEKVTVA